MDDRADFQPHVSDASAAEEAAFYGAALRHLTSLGLELADGAVIASELTRVEKVETIDRLSQMVRRNALVARHLHEPLRTPAPARSRGDAKPAKERTLREMSDEELDILYAEAVEREERERLERERRDTLPNRPIPEIIDRSCRDLGLGSFAAWQARTKADRQAESAQAPDPAPDGGLSTPGNPSPDDRPPETRDRPPPDPDTS